MKKMRSLRPAFDRMKHRLAKCRELPAAQQAAFYYCSGVEREAFWAAVAAGQAEAVTAALDVLSAGQWLRPRDRALYGRRMRESLYAACKAGHLKPQHKKQFEQLEVSLAVALLQRGVYAMKSPAQQRALRRLQVLQTQMRQCFGYAPDMLEYDEWPVVPAPAKQLRKAAQRGWFTAEQAILLEASSYVQLMQLLHGVEEELPAFRRLDFAAHPADMICCFFCERSDDTAAWVVAPFAELDELCGIILAEDASFCYVVDDWGDVYGCE